MKQILCFGDSNTYGLIPGTTDRYAWAERWTGILKGAVAEKGYRVIEERLCGRTTVFEDLFRKGRKGDEILPILLETHAPVEMVILMLGTNDCKTVYGADAGVIGKGIETLVEQIRRKTPETKILLISPIALGAGVWEEGFDPEFNRQSVQISMQLPRVYGKIAEEKGTYFMAASQYAVASDADREHLDREGHQKLAGAVCRYLERILQAG